MTTFTVKNMYGQAGEWITLIGTDGVVFSLPPGKANGLKLKVGHTYQVNVSQKVQNGKTKNYVRDIKALDAYDTGVTPIDTVIKPQEGEPQKPSMKDIQIRMMHSNNFAQNKASCMMVFETERMKAMGTMGSMTGSEYKGLYEAIFEEAYKESMDRLNGAL